MKRILFLVFALGLCAFARAQSQPRKAQTGLPRHDLSSLLPAQRGAKASRNENVFLNGIPQAISSCGVAEAWAARFNGNGDDDNAYAVAVDGSGNVYVTGNSNIGNSASIPDIVTIKYNAFGAMQWLVRHNGPGNQFDRGNAIALDASGNVYVTGVSHGAASNGDYITIKYNSSGVEQWAARFDGTENEYDEAIAIVVDGSGNVHVTGTENGSAVATQNYATVKYNSAGVQQWIVRYNGPGNSSDIPSDLAVDGSGNVYVTGRSTISTIPLDIDYATVKYNSAGVQQWVAHYDGPANAIDDPTALGVDNSGNVLVTGQSEGVLTFSDYATVKYNSAGVQQWVARYNGADNLGDGANDLALDGAGNVYVTGGSVASSSASDYATIKYNSAGIALWVSRYDGPGNDSDEARAITVDASGNVVVTGRSVPVFASTDGDYTTVKYNSAGVQQWEARYNGPDDDNDDAQALAVDGAGNVYVTGFSTGVGTVYDYGTIKYSAAGLQQWVARYGEFGGNMDVANALAVDASGNLYVTGHSENATTGFDYATIKYDAAGVEQWIAYYDGPENDNDEARAIAVDGAGNVYVTGSSAGSGPFVDYATIKYNSAGIEQWVARYNGPGDNNDEAIAIAVDAAGNVYVTGADDGGPATLQDYATIKYNSAGVEQWVARYNGPGSILDFASALALDGAGNVYITGLSNGVGTGADYATIKYNSAGAQVWIARYDGFGFDESAKALAVDGAGNIHVTGFSINAALDQDYATVKYNSTGAQQWVARYNGPGNNDDAGNAIAVDVAGNVYVTGRSIGVGSLDDYATIKYNPAGSEIWAVRYNGPGNDYDTAQGLALDGAGNAYVTGHSFDAGTQRDYATIKYDAAGVEEWVARYNGPANDEDNPNAIALDAAGNVYVTGNSASSTGDDFATVKYTQTGCSNNTPVGTNVAVSPNDLTTSMTPVALSFDQVTTAGNTSLTTSSIGPSSPAGFVLGTPPVYYHLSTTAASIGNIEVCIDYTGAVFIDETALRLYHYESGAWVDVTASQNLTDDVICGNVTSLSPFALFEPATKSFVFLANKITLKQTKQATPGGAIHSNGTLLVEKGTPSAYNSNLTAVGAITIQKSNTINGNVKSQTSISNAGTINGTPSIGPVANEPLPSKIYSAGGPNKTVPKNGTLVLAPGSYGIVTLNSASTLKLTSGEYFLNELRYASTVSTAIIEIDLSSGNPVNVNVVSNLQLGKEAALKLLPNGEADGKRVTFCTLQSAAVSVGKEAYFLGNLLAPNAKVTLVKNSQLRGSICAKEILIERDCLFLHHNSSGTLPGPGNLPKAFVDEEEADSYELEQNYPNPFNPSTVINFQLPVESEVSLVIYNLQGQQVRQVASGKFASGKHSVVWDGRNESGARVASGVYVYKLQAGEFVARRKLVLMK